MRARIKGSGGWFAPSTLGAPHPPSPMLRRSCAFLLLAATLTLGGCDTFGGDVPAGLAGTWEWKATEGGGWVPTVTPETAGYTLTLTLRNSGHYTLDQDGATVRSGRFSAVEAEGGPAVTFSPALSTDDVVLAPDPAPVSLDAETLVLGGGCCDRSASFFERAAR